MARLKVNNNGITEVKIPDCGRGNVEDSTILFSSGTTCTPGIALLLREHAKRSLKSWSPISPRLLTTSFIHRHNHLSIVVAYALTEGFLTDDKDNFYDQLYL